MKLLATLRDEDIIIGSPKIRTDNFSPRVAARAIVFDGRAAVALLHATKHSYHKLPGGGVEPGEDLASALAREIKEEIGCAAEVTGEVGQIDEYRGEWKLFQQSYCYLGRVVGPKGSPDFTQEELGDGFEIVWVASLEAAISLLEADRPANYDGKFIHARDLLLLRAAYGQTSQS